MTAFDHKDFKLNEQQEAVLDFMRRGKAVADSDGGWTTDYWFIAYELHGQTVIVRPGIKIIKIGDAGRRMRELRKEGYLESRKRGRFEEYRLAAPKERKTFAPFQVIDTPLEEVPFPGPIITTRTVHSREEAYDLEDKGWTIVERKTEGGFFTAILHKQ